MSKSIAIVVGGAMFLAAGMSLAQDVKVPAPKSTSTSTTTTTTQSGSPKMAQMDEHMTKKQALHAKMATAETPDEHQGLVAEQRQKMQLMMQSITDQQGTSGSGMMPEPTR